MNASTTRLQRTLLALLPALLLTFVATSAIWGDNGLVARAALDRDLEQAGRDLAAVERANERLLRELHLMDADPLVMERMVAEELGWGRKGATIYRFEEAPPR